MDNSSSPSLPPPIAYPLPPEAREAAARASRSAFGSALWWAEYYDEKIDRDGNPEYSDRFAALNEIAVAQAKAGDMTGAQAAFARAKALTAEHEPKEMSSALRSIAVAQAQAGDLAGARASASAATEPHHEAIARAALAAALAQAGDAAGAKAAFDEVKAALAGTQAVVARDEVAEALAKAQEAAGDFAGAKASAGEIDFTIVRSRIIREIAAAQAKAGDAAGARETLEQARAVLEASPTSYPQIYGLSSIAVAGASIIGKDWSEALFAQLRKRAVKLSKHERDKALAWIAGDQAKVGDLAAAHAAAAKISDAFDACNAVVGIAAAQAQAGDLAGARATLGRVSAGWLKTSGSAALVRALLRTGDLAGAKTATADVASAEGQAHLRREIAAAQAWAEGPTAASEWAESLKDRWLSHCYAALGAAEAAAAMSQGLAKPTPE